MNNSGVRVMVIGLAMVMAWGPCAAVAEEGESVSVPFDEEHWELAGEVVQHLGKTALRGGGVLKEVSLGDGVIDVDVALDGRRGFPGITFRMQDQQNTEIFYLRPHRNRGYGHALQYSPIFNGMTGWQLYSGAGFTAAADIPKDQWVHLRIELEGDRAQIYWNDLEQPALVVDRLVRNTAAGGISLTGGPGGQVHWADFSYHPGVKPDLGPRPVRAPAANMLRQWQVSPFLPLAEIDRLKAPADEYLEGLQWQAVAAEPSGLVNVSRAVALPRGTTGCVIARTTIAAPEAGVQRLDFGYSDEVSVLLNGTPLFFGASSFRQRDVEFMGVIGLHDSLPLALEKGNNELLFIVAEGFGGWGLMARLSAMPEGVITLGRGVSEAWRSTEGWQMPESAVVDAERQAVYVSNMAPSGPDMGESGFISKLGLDGQVHAMTWVSGLRAPTGLAIQGDRLYAAERSGVAVIDLDSGELETRMEMEGAGFFNDLAVADDGTVYVTDSRAGLIYRVENGQWSLWLDHPRLAGINGIAVDGGAVVVTISDSGMVLTIDRASAELEKIIDVSPCLHDGVVPLGEGHYLVSDYSGRILKVAPSGELTVLVDSTATGVGCADLGADARLGLVVVPSLYGNSVTTYAVGEQLLTSGS